jgi:hypothetical protein
MHPGDVLYRGYIPPWWWHTMRNNGTGPLAALSHRGRAGGFLSGRPDRLGVPRQFDLPKWPVLRAAFSDGPLDVLTADLGHLPMLSSSDAYDPLEIETSQADHLADLQCEQRVEDTHQCHTVSVYHCVQPEPH